MAEIDFERLRATHHPRPWLPTPEEAQYYGNSRARMGCPDQGEDLMHRYRKVLAGLKGISFTDEQYLLGFSFEKALADIVACEACQAQTFDRKVIGKTPDGTEMSVHVYQGCRTTAGHGMYLDLDRKKTMNTGVPVFVMRNCRGPSIRLSDLRELFLGRKVYEAHEPLVQSALSQESAESKKAVAV